MDNHSLVIVSEGRGNLELALSIAFGHAPGGKASHYAVIDGALVFFWTDLGPTPHKARQEYEEPAERAVQDAARVAANGDYAVRVHLRRSRVLEFQAQRCLYGMDAKAATEVADNWLRHSAEYGEQPDHDGSNGKGWRVFTDSTWGHVFGMYQGICGIAPEWAMYGK